MIHRHLESAILAGLADSPVVLLVGARQTGKSTLIQSPGIQKDDRRFLTLDDASVLAAAKTDPAGFLSSYPEPLALDEIQRAPELFLALKASVDRDRRPGRYLLSGSANVLFLPKVADSLAGRMEVLTLWPFSQGELEGVKEEFRGRALRRGAAAESETDPGLGGTQGGPAARASGGFPEVVARPSEERRKAWFGSYLTTLLQRDVRDLSRIEDMTAVPRLLSMVGRAHRWAFEQRRPVPKFRPGAKHPQALPEPAGKRFPRSNPASLVRQPRQTLRQDAQDVSFRQRFWRRIC